MGHIFKFLTKILIFCVCVFCILFVWMRWGEPNMVSVTKRDIVSENIPEAADGIRIALISDTHFGFDYSAAKFRRAVEKINEAEPHFVFFIGDLFEDYVKFPADDEEIIDALQSINATQGKFAVTGNHDYADGNERSAVSVLTAGGFTVLQNEREDFPLLGLSVTGVDDLYFGDGGAGSFNGLPGDTYNIVLCHEPDIFREVSGGNLGLQLSGHTHGGQVRLPFGGGALILPGMGKLYPMGHYSENGSDLFVTRGLGTSSLPFRFLCTPEVAVITLTNR